MSKDIFSTLRKEIVKSFVDTREEVLSLLASKEQSLLKKLEELENAQVKPSVNARRAKSQMTKQESLVTSTPDILALSKKPKKKAIKKNTSSTGKEILQNILL